MIGAKTFHRCWRTCSEEPHAPSAMWKSISLSFRHLFLTKTVFGFFWILNKMSINFNPFFHEIKKHLFSCSYHLGLQTLTQRPTYWALAALALALDSASSKKLVWIAWPRAVGNNSMVMFVYSVHGRKKRARIQTFTRMLEVVATVISWLFSHMEPPKGKATAGPLTERFQRCKLSGGNSFKALVTGSCEHLTSPRVKLRCRRASTSTSTSVQLVPEFWNCSMLCSPSNFKREKKHKNQWSSY